MTAPPAPAWPTPPGGVIARRASCRSARAGRSSTSAPPTTTGLSVEIVLANTYHLMLRPGADVVARFGGIGRFAGWDGLTLTDSGGFQVFSLGPAVDDEGVTFRSVYDGSMHRLTPESAVAVQELIGADIQMVLDVCPALPSPPEVVELAVERTLQWAVRARSAHRRDGQSLFGIVQGGVALPLRADCARATADLDFDGYAIGGLSVGESRAEMLPALAAALEHLPPDRPRYLMGVGDPVSMLEAVARGVDQFDCVLQTRLGRHGTALTAAGKVQLKAARHADEDVAVDSTCACEVCSAAQPRLPATPVRNRRADRIAPAHVAQRGVDGAAARPGPGRHHRWVVRGNARRGAVGLGDALSIIFCWLGAVGRRFEDTEPDDPEPPLRSPATQAAADRSLPGARSLTHHDGCTVNFLANSSGGGGAAIAQLGILLLIPLALYFLMIRPQRRKARSNRRCSPRCRSATRSSRPRACTASSPASRKRSNLAGDRRGRPDPGQPGGDSGQGRYQRLRRRYEA